MNTLMASLMHIAPPLLGGMFGVMGVIFGLFRHQQAKVAQIQASSAQAGLDLAESPSDGARDDEQALAATAHEASEGTTANQHVAALTDSYIKKGLKARTRA